MATSNLAAILTAAAGVLTAAAALIHSLRLSGVVRQHKANPYVHGAKVLPVQPAAQLTRPGPVNGVQAEQDQPR